MHVCIRLNIYFKIKDKTGIESKFNILSDFYSIDDLEVD